MWKKEGWEERITGGGEEGDGIKNHVDELKKKLYIRGERGDRAKQPEQRVMTNAQKVGFSGGRVSRMRRREWKRDEEKRGLQSGEPRMFLPVIYHCHSRCLHFLFYSVAHSRSSDYSHLPH